MADLRKIIWAESFGESARCRTRLCLKVYNKMIRLVLCALLCGASHNLSLYSVTIKLDDSDSTAPCTPSLQIPGNHTINIHSKLGLLGLIFFSFFVTPDFIHFCLLSQLLLPTGVWCERLSDCQICI